MPRPLSQEKAPRRAGLSVLLDRLAGRGGLCRRSRRHRLRILLGLGGLRGRRLRFGTGVLRHAVVDEVAPLQEVNGGELLRRLRLARSLDAVRHLLLWGRVGRHSKGHRHGSGDGRNENFLHVLILCRNLPTQKRRTLLPVPIIFLTIHSEKKGTKVSNLKWGRQVHF